MLFVFPQGRFSATKALAHKYFVEFLEKEEKLAIPINTEEMKGMQMNLNDYKSYSIPFNLS